MNRNAFALSMMTAALIGVIGCGKKTDVNSQLERAAATLNEAPPATPTTQPVAKASQTPAQQVNQAVTSFKGGDYNAAVSQLHTLLVQGSKGQVPMSPQQYMALQDATGAVLQDLYTRAAKGDARAQQAVKEYERLQKTR